MLLKMPVGQALNAHTALQKMMAAQFPAKQAFAISRNIARLGACPDVPACEAARLAAIRNFGVLLPDGGILVRWILSGLSWPACRGVFVRADDMTVEVALNGVESRVSKSPL